MTGEERSFDDLIRKKVAAQQPEFKEAYWLHAKAYIDKQRRKRRFLWFGAFIFVGISSALIASYYLGSFEPAGLQQQAQIAHVPASDAGLAASMATPTVGSTETEISGQTPATTPTPAGSTRAEEQEITSSTRTNKVDAGHPEVNAAPASASPSSLTSQATVSANKAITQCVTSTNETPSKPITKDAAQDPPAASEDVAPTAATTEESERTDLITASAFNFQWIASRPLAFFKMPDWTRPDCDSCTKARQALVEKTTGEKQKRYVSLEAGMIAANSMQLRAVNFTGGLRYTHFLTSQWALRAGVFYARTSQNTGIRTYDRSLYDFGKNKGSLRVETTRLDYLEVPFDILFNSNAHSAHAGISYLYLLETSERVQTLDEQGNTVNTKTGRGYFDAQSASDWQLSLGYTWFSESRLYADLTFFYGLMDITNDAIYRKNSFDSNKGLKLSIGYRLF